MHGPLRTVVAAVAVAGCGPIVADAPFPARPDTVRAGDLLGPFDGVVVDADTDRPLEGAIVSVAWAFERGVGLVGPDGAQVAETEAGPDGRFRIEALADLPSGLSTRVRRVTLTAYKKGFVAWRSDHRFPDGLPRRDFSQRGARIRLEPWRTNLSRVQHALYAVGGPRLSAALAWERQAAALELEGRGATEAAGTDGATVAGALDISAVLSAADLRAVTGYGDPLEVGRLADLPTTGFYDSLHFKAAGKPESHDVAVRLWRQGPDAVEAQWRAVMAALPGATAGTQLGDATIALASADVRALAFVVRDRGIVVSITCGVAQCADEGQIVRIGKLVEGKLDQIRGGDGIGAAPALPRPPLPGVPNP